ncbi:MAG TPA: ribonuclease P protein subunit [Thermoplasmata archaeon]|nr:ribonuclease P protein subunit [Thermoplasmata archaeon]
MAALRPDPRELSPDERTALAGELIGAPVRVPAGTGRGREVVGTIVDETLGTFVVRPAGDGPLVRLPKAGLTGTIGLAGHELPLRGDLLRVRPEDRTKRLLAGGPRRFR